VLNLLVATDGVVAELGADVRRLRPNLLIGGVPADAERRLPGHALVIGDAVIGIHSVRQRCIVTSIDPGTGDQDLEVFRRIRRRFGNEVGLNCWVIRPSGCHPPRRPGQPPAHYRGAERIGWWVVGRPYPA
jgi:hypothetical protein